MGLSLSLRTGLAPGSSGFPDWLLPQVPGNGIQYELTRDQYWLGNGLTARANVLSDTRASDALFDNTAGVYSTFAPNVPAITDRGLYPGGQFTNKNAAHNFNPALVTPVDATTFNGLAVPGTTAGYGGGALTGLFGIVADAAKVATAGLGAIGNGNVFQVDMTVDTVGSGYFFFDNAVGNTNPHSWGAWVRNDSVDATLRMVGSASYGAVTYAPGPEYSFVKAENWTPDATARFRPQIPIGSILRLFGMQLVESAFLPQPIVTAGAPATRLADSIVNPNYAAHAAAFGFASGMAALARVNLTRLSDPSARRIATFGTAADGAYIEFTAANTFKAVLRKAGADAVPLLSGTVSATGVYDVTVQFKAGAYSLTVSDGIAGDVSASAETLPAAIASAAYIGQSASTTLHLNGPLERLAMWGVAA